MHRPDTSTPLDFFLVPERELAAAQEFARANGYDPDKDGKYIRDKSGKPCGMGWADFYRKHRDQIDQGL